MRWILLAAAAYALVFIWRSSFVIEGTRYFCLFDDAMISMRYARNLVDGWGLVWNPGGPRVEGYTNLLWVLYMAAVHLLPIPDTSISVVIQLTGAVALAGTTVLVARLADRLTNGSRLAVASAATLTAFYHPLASWALQGMEVGVLTLLVTASVWLAIVSLDSPRPPVLLYTLLGVATLVRLDAVIPLVVISAFLFVADPRRRHWHAVATVCTLATCVGGQTLFREVYYGALLPNTYYLKMEGYPALLRLARGITVFALFVVELAIGLALIAPGFRYIPRNRITALLGSVALAQAAYSVYVGGDAWENGGGSNRYLAVAMPLIFVLAASGIEGLHRRWSHRGMARPGLLAVLLTGVTVVLLNVASAPDAGRRWLFLRPPLGVPEVAGWVRAALVAREVSSPRASVGVVAAGAGPYFMERTAVDLLGKSDPVIARRPMRLPPRGLGLAAIATWFLPGHLKYDYAYSIGVLRPDILIELWRDPEEAKPYLADYDVVVESGVQLYLRRGSPNVKRTHAGGPGD